MDRRTLTEARVDHPLVTVNCEVEHVTRTFADRPASEVFVVVAAYNECSVLAETLAPLVASGYSTVVVDDGSSDDSWSVLQNLPVYALRHPTNLGQGAALQTGVEFALSRGARYIVHFDADGQHCESGIPSLLAPLWTGEADIVFGSRFLRREDTRQIPWQRNLLLRVAISVNYLFTGLRLTDAHNGFRAMTASAAGLIRIRENRSAHATEILTLVRKHRLRVTERPTTVIYTSYSRAKGQRGLAAFGILFDLLMRRFVRWH